MIRFGLSLLAALAFSVTAAFADPPDPLNWRALDPAVGS
jgi:hypothetical protein